MIQQVKQLTQNLRLFGIHNAVERRAEEAVTNHLHPLEFMRIILEEEAGARRLTTAKRLDTRARFQFKAELEDWDGTFERGISKQKMKELAMLNFFRNHENLIICGKTGEGKTQLAISLGKRMCREEITISQSKKSKDKNR